MAKPQNVSDNNFEEEVIDSSMPVLVDFWAQWCGPCKMIAPVLEELAEDYDGRVKFVRVNVDTNPKTSSKYSIRSIPSLLIFVNGEQVEHILGAVAKKVLTEKLDEVLA